MIAAAFLSYAGPFLSNYRDELVEKTWLAQVLSSCHRFMTNSTLNKLPSGASSQIVTLGDKFEMIMRHALSFLPRREDARPLRAEKCCERGYVPRRKCFYYDNCKIKITVS